MGLKHSAAHSGPMHAMRLLLALAALPALAGCSSLMGQGNAATGPNDEDIGTSGWIIEKSDFHYRESRMDGGSWRESETWNNPKGAGTVEVKANITGGNLRIKVHDAAGNIAWDGNLNPGTYDYLVPLGEEWAKGKWRVVFEAREASGNFRLHLFMRPYP